MSDFKLGEVVIGQGFVSHPQYNGLECEIVEELRHRDGRLLRDNSLIKASFYKVRWSNGEENGVFPQNLRRRKPPASDSHERTYMQMWRDMAGKAPQPVGEPA